MNFEIKKLKGNDALAVSDIEKECFSLPWSESCIRQAIERDFFVGAFVGDILAGYAGMSTVLDECDILNIAVKKEFRSGGIGKSLVAALLSYAKSKNAAIVMLEVRKSNSVAISLYEKAGFSKVGERKNFYESPREDALLYNFYIKK